ncbi:hypothetical protein AAHA92_20879 [Salvia divinorum]|uniref:RING-CH-type domain-containing protein n=1 Tax=Salvia divinorum TaxID=28513 RepID=A0ABD1GIM1_SALDI
MSETVLFIDDLRSLSPPPPSSSSSAVSKICRICHEEEFESCQTLETPCACSGSVKFAHRDCVQRWCDEKGNTTCEICLQKFEPGYTSPPKKIQLIDATVTIRVSLEVARNEQEEENERLETECEDGDNRCASFCRTLVLIFTALLLTRHLFGVVSGAGDYYPFSLVTVLIAKASGILVPMYILIRILAALQTNIRHHYQNADTDSDEDEDEEQRHSS